MHRNDGGIVDAELLRPRWWIAQHKIVAGNLLPMNIKELQVHGSAIVTAVEECPEIAPDVGWALSPTDGDAGRFASPTHRTSVVTARFITREVNTIARAEIIGPDGTIETISGTPVHPIWSIDRDDWIQLSELQEGERLQATDGIATVVSIAIVSTNVSVYNLEVHGQHVYAVGELGLLVHNTCPTGASVNGIADTISGSRSAALRTAKEANGIPRSAQPLRTIKPNNPEGIKLGLDDRNVVLYEYLNSAGQKIHIRLDKPASFGGPGGVGDQGWHSNAGPAFEKLKQHHFFGN